MAARPYESPLRRQQSADTRERIITAGSELGHGITSWDWGSLTFQAVADRAGVGRPAVFRPFGIEPQPKVRLTAAIRRRGKSVQAQLPAADRGRRPAPQRPAGGRSRGRSAL